MLSVGSSLATMPLIRTGKKGHINRCGLLNSRHTKLDESETHCAEKVAKPSMSETIRTNLNRERPSAVAVVCGNGGSTGVWRRFRVQLRTRHPPRALDLGHD